MNNHNKNNNYILFCDMDGVICDFYYEIRKMSTKHFGEPLNFEELEIKLGKEKLWEFIDGYGEEFWSNLGRLDRENKLYNFIFKNFKQIKILSSKGKSKHGESGKRKWLLNNGFHKLNEKDIIIVPNAAYKKHFARQNHILIDDMKRNISDWIEFGGIGILHTTIDDTINKLNKILKS